MKQLLAAAIVACGFGTAPSAAIIGVNDTNGSILNAGTVSASNTGVFASKIAAPAFVLDDLVVNRAMQGFDEAQNVALGGSGVLTDQGAVGANMRVDSHMIFLNSSGTTRIGHFGVEWTFSGTILGVMSDYMGTNEANSSSILGAAGTQYSPGLLGNPAAPFAARGMEHPNDNNILGTNRGCGTVNDGYLISGNTLCVSMLVTEPGDWIRVVTVSAVPVPAALPLMLAGLGGLGFMARRKSRKAA